VRSHPEGQQPRSPEEGEGGRKVTRGGGPRPRERPEVLRGKRVKKTRDLLNSVKGEAKGQAAPISAERACSEKQAAHAVTR